MEQQITSQLPVILVDDESTVLLSSRMVLGSAGIGHIKTVQDSRELMPLLARQEAAGVVLDLFMPYLSGSQLLPEIHHEYPDLPVIEVTPDAIRLRKRILDTTFRKKAVKKAKATA